MCLRCQIYLFFSLHDYWLGLTNDQSCLMTGLENGCSTAPVNNSVCSATLDPAHPAYRCCLCRSRWGWADGTSVTYLNWQPTEPTSGDLCARLRNNQWADRDCVEIFRYICERPLTTTEGENV